MNNPNPAYYYFHPNYRFPQNQQHYFQPHSNENFANYRTPEIQASMPIVQQNYYNYPFQFNPPQHQMIHNYNAENNFRDFSAPKDLIKPFKEEIETGKYKKNRKERTTYTKSQLQILEHYFNINPYPDIAVREAIKVKIQISESHIQVWFKNRRAKVKRSSRKIERDKESIKNSEILCQNNSDSEKEILCQSKNVNGTPPVTEMKNELNENIEPPYVNNNNNGNIPSYNNHLLPDDIIQYQQNQQFYTNYTNYMNYLNQIN